MEEAQIDCPVTQFPSTSTARAPVHPDTARDAGVDDEDALGRSGCRRRRPRSGWSAGASDRSGGDGHAPGSGRGAKLGEVALS